MITLRKKINQIKFKEKNAEKFFKKRKLDGILKKTYKNTNTAE